MTRDQYNAIRARVTADDMGDRTRTSRAADEATGRPDRREARQTRREARMVAYRRGGRSR